MGEEEKKPAGEEKKPEEENTKRETKEEAKSVEKPAAEGKKGEEPKEGKESKEDSPPPPQQIVLKVYMHCEGCARKVRRCLKGFDGVEHVNTDCKTSKVVVIGDKADPLKVVERVRRKSHRQVELISPIPKPPSVEEEKKKVVEEKEKPKPPEEKKEEAQAITVVLKVFMHCEACAMEIKKRIQRMKGVESAEPDLKSSEVTVKGVFDPANLVEYVYKRTGKQAIIVKQEPEKKEEEKGKESKDEKKGGEEGEKEKEKKGGGDLGDNKEEDGNPDEETTEETTVVELMRNEYYHYHYPQSYQMEMYHAYPPQIFSDENPNACTLM